MWSYVGRVVADQPSRGRRMLDLAQRMPRGLFGDPGSDEEPWAEATRRPRERSETTRGNRDLSAERQRDNLTFALATR